MKLTTHLHPAARSLSLYACLHGKTGYQDMCALERRIGAVTREIRRGNVMGRFEGKVAVLANGASSALRNLSKTQLILTIILFNDREKFYFPKIKISRKSVQRDSSRSIRTDRLTDVYAEADSRLPHCSANATKCMAGRWHFIANL